MRSALYYPHTQIRDESFLKNALLFWDEVSFISPTKHFQFDSNLPTHVHEALELLCRPYVPDPQEKGIAHSRVEELLRNGVPQWLVKTEIPESILEGRKVREFYGADYGMYPQKLSPETWDLLANADLVRLDGSDYDYYVQPLVGLYLMSLLANVCAGNTREQITDRVEAYSFLWRLAAAEGNAEVVSSQDSEGGATLDRLVTISINAIDTDNIEFANILALRRREAAGDGSDYRAFRRKYASKLQDQAVAIATNARTVKDREELERQLAADLRDDLASLKSELRAAKQDLMFSKGMLTTVVAAGASLLGPISTDVLLGSAQALGIGMLMSDLLKFRGHYNDALKEHAASWLYLAQRPSTRDLPIRKFGGSRS